MHWTIVAPSEISTMRLPNNPYRVLLKLERDSIKDKYTRAEKIDLFHEQLEQHFEGHEIDIITVPNPKNPAFQVMYRMIPKVAVEERGLPALPEAQMKIKVSKQQKKHDEEQELKNLLQKAVLDKYNTIPDYDGNLTFNGWQPMSHQERLIRWSIPRKKVLIGIPPRCGKTLIATGTAMNSGNNGKTLIVCPRMLVEQWRRDCKREGLEADILHYNGSPQNRAGIQSYYRRIKDEKDVRFTKSALLKRRYNCVIIDESHKIKNPNTAYYQCLQKMIDECKPEYILLLTGTPNPNNNGELWTQLKLIDHPAGQITKTQWDLCFNNHRMKGENTDDKQYRKENLQILKEIVSPCVTLESRKSLGVELSEYRLMPIALEPPAELKKILSNIKMKDLKYLMTKGSLDSQQISNSLVKMRQVCAAYKLPFTNKYLNQAEGKVVVGSNFNSSVLDKLGKEHACGVLKGDTRMERRLELIDNFQSWIDKVLLVQICIADCGLDLSAASSLVFNDLHWSLGVFIQFLSRPLNVKKKTVTDIVIPYFKGTIEEGMMKVLIRKAENFEALLNDLDESDEDQLLSKQLNVLQDFTYDYWTSLYAELRTKHVNHAYA